MDIHYLGANCLKISTKNTVIFVDPVVPGLKVDTKKSRVNLLTNKSLVEFESDSFMIDTPGEYEIGGLTIRGIAARGHMDEVEGRSATIFKITHDNVNVVIIGHAFPKLSDDQLEAIGMVDILVLPVGGNGYTIDSTGAAQLVRKIEPKIAIPTHFADKEINYEVPQAELKTFLDEMGASPEKLDDFKVGKNTVLPEQLQIIVLKRDS